MPVTESSNFPKNLNLQIVCVVFLTILYSCTMESEVKTTNANVETPYIFVLGIAQDAGFPQADCKKACCREAWNDPSKRQMVASLGIVDPESRKSWMIDATPDFKDQLRLLKHHSDQENSLSGIFLTHAHIGHYTGLVHLGREVIGTSGMPVFAMPKMRSFLAKNGPWSQLVSLNNIDLQELQSDSAIVLNSRISVTPVQVPHRDEYSETVGYRIFGKENSVLYIPDIDKWSKWDGDLKEEIRINDFLLIDGSFYANGEIPNRDMSEIPHPFIAETMEFLEELPIEQRSKVHFIHLNHTNPLLNPLSSEHQDVIHKGYQICKQSQIILL